jgi:hypothetical protein
MENNHQDQVRALTEVISRLDHEFQESEADVRNDFQSQRDDTKNRNLEEKQTLRIQMENALEELWRQFQKVTIYIKSNIHYTKGNHSVNM